MEELDHSLLSPGIIPEDDFSCWRSFVLACQAINITAPMSKRIDITKADALFLFLQFCNHFQQQYGTDAETLNMHWHCHLANCLKDYGPVYSFSLLRGLASNVNTCHLPCTRWKFGHHVHNACQRHASK